MIYNPTATNTKHNSPSSGAGVTGTAWACQLSQSVNLVKYFNKESYVTVENVSQYVKWNIFNGLHSPIPSYLSAPPDIKISKNISFYISCLSVFINIKSDIFSFFYNLQ